MFIWSGGDADRQGAHPGKSSLIQEFESPFLAIPRTEGTLDICEVFVGPHGGGRIDPQSHLAARGFLNARLRQHAAITDKHDVLEPKLLFELVNLRK
jgi:hypothetical protein